MVDDPIGPEEPLLPERGGVLEGRERVGDLPEPRRSLLFEAATGSEQTLVMSPLPRGQGALVLANPPADPIDVEPLIERAVAAAEAEGVSGQRVTPFVLDYLHRESGGRTQAVNERLIADNAGLAAEVAVAYAR